MNKKEFDLCREIAQGQPWLNEKLEVLQHLLQTECRNDEERRLIAELLKRFTFLRYDETVSKRNYLADKIVNDKDLSDTNTQIVAMSADSGADSGQWLLYELKPLLDTLGWKKHLLINAFGKSYKKYKEHTEHKNIVLIDEFVGTGQTASNRVKELVNVYKNNKVEGIKIKVRVIACTEEALVKLRREGVDIDSEIILKKGISDFNSNKDAGKKIARLDRICEKLSKNFNGRARNNLGFGDTESLYGRENGNCPNSVFPVFWWSVLENEDDRATILTRAMADA